MGNTGNAKMLSSNVMNGFDFYIRTFYTATGIVKPDVNLQPIAYPNPFHEKINIEYFLDEWSTVEIALYDVTGKKKVDIVNEHQISGKHLLMLDGKDHNLLKGVSFISVRIRDKYYMKKLYKL